MPSFKTLILSPFRFGTPKIKDRIRSSSQRKRKNRQSSNDTTCSRVTATTAAATTIRDQQFREEETRCRENLCDQRDLDDADLSRIDVMASTSADSSSNDEAENSNDHNDCGVCDDEANESTVENFDASSTPEDTSSNDNADDCKNDSSCDIGSEEAHESMVEAVDSMESNLPASDAGIDDHIDDDLSEARLDYLPNYNLMSQSKVVESILNKIEENGYVNKLFSGKVGHDDNDNDNNNDDEIDHQESPINSVVFEKQIETGIKDGRSTEKIETAGPLSPLLSPSSGGSGRDSYFFDDYRSTISGLTEASNYRGAEKRTSVPPSPTNSASIPPSPTNSTISAVNKKMEDFIKTETEVIRQLLTDVDNGDDESTVVEDSILGANEAEQMAREMEREMKLLVKGSYDLLPTTSYDSIEEGNPKDKTSTDNTFGLDSPKINYLPQQDTPDSYEFLLDIHSVIHPGADASVDQSLLSSSISDVSYRPSFSSRRDPFQKRGALSRFKRKMERKRMIRKKIRRQYIKIVLRALFLGLILLSTVFVVNWQWNFSDKNFSDATNSTMAQIKRTKSATKSYIEAQVQFCTTKVDAATVRFVTIFHPSKILDAKNNMINGLQQTSSHVISETKYYTSIIALVTKIHATNGLKATNSLALRLLQSYFWTPEANLQLSLVLKATSQYAKDRLEYAFTDRAAREQRLEEELRLQRIMEAAKEAAVQEAAEKQQQLWTQTMIAGACAFIGSVATNYLWAVM
jgi:hypothetical protein